MKYIIPGDPIALARCRFAKDRLYDSQKQLKLFWQIHLYNQHFRRPLYSGPLHFDVVFYMRIPVRPKKYQKPGLWHRSAPDLSNLLKFIEDIGTGVLYHDDRIIASTNMKKVYDENERTELIITELDQ